MALNVVHAVADRLGIDRADAVQDLKALLGQPRLSSGTAKLVSPNWGKEAPVFLLVHVLQSDGKATERLVRDALTAGMAQLPSTAGGQTMRLGVAALGAGAGGLTPEASARAMHEVLSQWDAPNWSADVVTWSGEATRTFIHVWHGGARSPYALERFREATEGADEQAYEALVEALVANHTFLFVGSGLSFNARPAMPSWPALFDPSWFRDRGVDERGTVRFTPEEKVAHLPDFAQIVADRESRSVVRDQFLKAISATRSVPSTLHYQLLALPWAAVLTTNYDTLVEQTLAALNIPAFVVKDDASLSRLPEEAGVPVIKLHGGLGGDGVNDVVATREDYDRFFEARPALAAYLESRLMTSRGVIVGYSVTDPHLRHMFARIGRTADQKVKRRRLLCLSFQESPVSEYWQHRGLEPIVVRDGSPSNFESLVDVVTSEAQARIGESLLPSGHVSVDLWRQLAAGLTDAQTVGLVSSLMAAGCGPPPRDVLERVFASGSRRDALVSALARALSPEQMHSLRVAVRGDVK